MSTIMDPPEGNSLDPIGMFGGQVQANIVVINDSAGRGLATGTAGYAVRNGVNDQFGVHLLTAPPAGVTVVVDVGVYINPGAGMTVSPASLSFTSANFGTDQIVTLTGLGQAVQSGIRAQVRGGGGMPADVLVVG
jgi:hypothetical protein